MFRTWLPGVCAVSGSPSKRSTSSGSAYPRCPTTCIRPLCEPSSTSVWQPTAGMISSATSWMTSWTLAASVRAPARDSTCEIVTRLDGPPGLRPARSSSATARARVIRTLSPVALGYSRNDSQSPGGRSATNEVTCRLNSAAR